MAKIRGVKPKAKVTPYLSLKTKDPLPRIICRRQATTLGISMGAYILRLIYADAEASGVLAECEAEAATLVENVNIAIS